MVKLFLSSFCFVLLLLTNCFSKEVSSVGTSLVLTDGGNKGIALQVNPSTTIVLISSAAPFTIQVNASTNSLTQISEWRYREIVNASPDRGLTLYPDGTRYNFFSSTIGIFLSSDTKGLGAGDSYIVPHQGEVWGVWSGTIAPTGGGAAGMTSHYKR